MKGWKRSMDFDATGLPWVMPSPNMPTLDTAFVYPGLCLVEGTNLSEGRGTTRPFEIVGAPFLDGYRWAERLGRLHLPGVRFRPLSFLPMFHKFARQSCGGVQLHVTNRATFRPYRTGVALLHAARELAPGDFAWRTEAYEFVERPAGDRSADRQRRRTDWHRRGTAVRGDLRAVRRLREPVFGGARAVSAVRLKRISCRAGCGQARSAVMRYALAMRIALFGGSFNPPHLGHQLAALYVLETAGVDELWLVPTFQHPFDKALEPFEDRLAMCRLAADALGPRARVTDVERELGDESRTLRTVRALQARHPEHRFALVIGADLVAETATWYGAEELRATVPFIVVGRAGHSAGAGPRAAGRDAGGQLDGDPARARRGEAGDRARVARRPRLHPRARAVRSARRPA